MLTHSDMIRLAIEAPEILIDFLSDHPDQVVTLWQAHRDALRVSHHAHRIAEKNHDHVPYEADAPKWAIQAVVAEVRARFGLRIPFEFMTLQSAFDMDF